MEPSLGLIITILIIALFVRLNVYLAKQRGRSELGWGIAGFLFGIFSTLVLLVLGETEDHRIETFRRATEKRP